MTSVDQHGLPSPVESAQSPTASHTSSLTNISTLPSQRHHPLAPGSPKEIALINYVDTRVLYITRRYATKFTDIKTKANESPGYIRLEEFIQDLNPLIDLVWATGTHTLQIPYMLTFAGMVVSYLPAFPFTNNMFPLLKRLDLAFSSLLRAHNTVVESRSAVSLTEKVRIKSLVDETRVVAMQHGLSAGHAVGDAEESENDEDDDDGNSEIDDESDGSITQNLKCHANSLQIPVESRQVAMALSKIYESTIGILGDIITNPTAPVQTDDIMDTS